MVENKSLWSLEDFLDSYTAKGTKLTYSSTLKDFFKFIYPELKDLEAQKPKQNDPTKAEFDKEYRKSLSTLSLQYLRDKRDYEKDIVKYKKTIIDQAPKTVSVKTTAVISFLAKNNIEFSTRTVRSLYEKNRESISIEYIPTAEDIIRIIEFMPIQAKTMTLFLASSGVRIGEALQLKTGDIMLSSNPVTIKIPAEITKTQKSRVTFITSEAAAILREWLVYKPKFIKINRDKLGKEVDEDRVFPFSANSFRDIWTKAINKAGLFERDERTHFLSLRPHSLRKYFRTRAKWTNTDIPEILMGHQAGMNRVYARYAPGELAEEYLKAEPGLSIYEQSKNIIELNEKIKKQEDDVDAIIRNTSIRNAKLENEIEELRVKHKQTFEEVMNWKRADDEDWKATINSLVDRVRQLEEERKRTEEMLDEEERDKLR